MLMLLLMTLQVVLIVLSVLTLIGSLIWSIKDKKNWEARLVVLAAISGLIVLIRDSGQEYDDQTESSPKAVKIVTNNKNSPTNTGSGNQNITYDQREIDTRENIEKFIDLASEDVINPNLLPKLSKIVDFSLEGYRVSQFVKLKSSNMSLNGAILIVVDEKLEGFKSEFKYHDYGKQVTVPTFKSVSDLFDPGIAQSEFKQAQIMILGSDLSVTYREQLGRAAARIDQVHLYENLGKSTFVLTRDYSIGAGSYNGPISYFIEIDEGGIKYLFNRTGLMTSLKSAWCISHRTVPKEILLQSSSYNNDYDSNDRNQSFITTYTRFYFERGQWLSSEYQEFVFWENETGVNIDKFY